MDRLQRTVLLTLLDNQQKQLESIRSVVMTFACEEERGAPAKAHKLERNEDAGFDYTSDEEDDLIEQRIIGQQEEILGTAFQEAARDAGQEQNP